MLKCQLNKLPPAQLKNQAVVQMRRPHVAAVEALRESQVGVHAVVVANVLAVTPPSYDAAN